MHALALVLFVALAGPSADTGRAVQGGERPLPDGLLLSGDSMPVQRRPDAAEPAVGPAGVQTGIPDLSALVAGVTRLPSEPAGADTVPRRRRSVEIGEWYERRLRLHRYGAYTVIPLFAFQAIAGNQVYQKGDGAPGWAKTGHRAGAGALAGVFTLNTVTGLWNLWDSRTVEQGRTRRTVHALLMLASDAGFTYAGVRLSEQAETDASKRDLHRKFAYASMATALTGAGVMVFGND